MNRFAAISKARSAGMARATAGRARAFGTGRRPQQDDSAEQVNEAMAQRRPPPAPKGDEAEDPEPFADWDF